MSQNDSNKLRTELAVKSSYDGTVSTGYLESEALDMQGFSSFLAQLLVVAGTGGLATTAGLRLVAYDNASKTGTPVVVKSYDHAAPVNPDAPGDFVNAECSAEEIAAACAATGYKGRWIVLQHKKVTGADTHARTLIRGRGKVEDGLTADYIQ